eukprot:TRINITY_DN128_c0_g1_i1.p1 TRINITY_DN128_c0_g1~~TRINITY_DN128_c0_g1_i1.p1  ORF type:complete len:594 (-),score=80.98 TRINITY_DN128_c0_g1_i1:68-1849(-)
MKTKVLSILLFALAIVALRANVVVCGGENMHPPPSVTSSQTGVNSTLAVVTQAAKKHAWALKLAHPDHAIHYARKHNLVYAGQVGSLADYHLFEHAPRLTTNTKSVEQVHAHLEADETLEWMEYQAERQHYKRLSFNDPSYSAQWHLHNPSGVDVGIAAAWERGLTGEGLTISIVDDGLEHTHPDFKDHNVNSRYVASASHDWNDNVPDPRPKLNYDTHGTRCAGLAFASAHNGICGVGSAYNAKFSGQRLISKPTTDAQEAQALTYALNVNDIYSSSWGPTDDGRRMEGAGVLVKAAFKHAVATGRNGKGTIYVWAGGNGAGGGDNVNYDGYANSIYTIAIAAVGMNGVKSPYSEPGAPLLVSVPSSPLGLTTITINNGCSGGFGGTSAAAPLAAGIIALVLQANPNLTWRDVQDVLARSAVMVNSGDDDWTTNGAGLHVNHKYGFGLLHADAACEAAQQHQNLPPARPVPAQVSSSFSHELEISSEGLETSLNINDHFVVEHVEVVVRLVHPARGELQISVESPDGTRANLFEPHNDRNPNIANWTFMSMRSWGENSAGKWTLKVRDVANNASRGVLVGWSVIVHGHVRHD